MTDAPQIEDAALLAGEGAGRKRARYHFARHDPEYRERFEEIAVEMLGKCPVAWSDTYDGHWVAASHEAVYELAHSVEFVSNDNDVINIRRGYKGISIPAPSEPRFQGGFLEMDPPAQQQYRRALDPYLSPAAVNRWVPLVDELVRACLDEKIESGRIDFVDDLATVVPAVLTLAMLGVPLAKWAVYCEPAHASIYTPPGAPQWPVVQRATMDMYLDLYSHLTEIKAAPRPGLIDALARATINGRPADEMELIGVLALLVGGGFATTTALTAHSLEWLGEHPEERARLSAERGTLLDSATEEFLRFYTPAPGDGRTVSADCQLAGTEFKEGERLWLSWAMSNRDPKVFANPNEIDLARTGNRHHSFGLGIHRCIGSNVARMVFKRMLVAVLDRMPDYACDPAGAVHYQTIGVIQGMQHLPAVFTPGPRVGDGLDETLARLQKICEQQRLADPVTVRAASARVESARVESARVEED